MAALVIGVLLTTAGAQAATLNVVGGELVGASGVDVGGSLYDVQFVEGSCISLYGGCDELSDFVFTSVGDATAASQALLDQVLIDGGAGNFDTNYTDVLGCAPSSVLALCGALTAFGQIDADEVNVASAINYAVEASDFAGHGTTDRTYDTSAGGLHELNTYAIWSPVPEPGTGLLVGLGLLALGARSPRGTV